MQFKAYMQSLAIKIVAPAPWLCHRLLVGLWYMGCWIIQFLGFRADPYVEREKLGKWGRATAGLGLELCLVP